MGEGNASEGTDESLNLFGNTGFSKALSDSFLFHSCEIANISKATCKRTDVTTFNIVGPTVLAVVAF